MIPRFPFAFCLPGLTAAVAACSGTGAAAPGPLLAWRPLTSVNTSLPAQVQVFHGVNDSVPLRAWYVLIDDSGSEIETEVRVSDDSLDRRETVSSFGRDPGACVAVNGGYFSMERTPAVHAGLLVVDGRVVAPATATVTRDSLSYPAARAAIGWTAGGVQIRWASTRGDTVVAWDAPPANRPGHPAPPLEWARAARWPVTHALAAGPALVVNGDLRVTADEEVFFGSSIPAVHPRTAAGRTATGELIWMVVDGRQPQSRGVSLEELARLMRSAGAVEALNLDGGGSSALVVNGVLLNRPAGGTLEREVMSALVATCTGP
ncbi:MAG TPA: phosphodiester glycosidase family protein [Gemmatimonadales bacterium]|nr:phosphodiester glycosidase family protein [Gemmatimonadales bacterium]